VDSPLPFAKDRQPEYPETYERGHLSKKQKAALCLAQGGRCAGCKIKPRYGWEYDHIVELWEGGTNAFDNWQAFGSKRDCDCHVRKSKAAAKRRAKMHRLRGNTGQKARRAKNGPSLTSAGRIQSRGFEKRTGPSSLSKAYRDKVKARVGK